MARTGLRMMPAFPSPFLKFRTVGFPSTASRLPCQSAPSRSTAWLSLLPACPRSMQPAPTFPPSPTSPRNPLTHQNIRRAKTACQVKRQPIPMLNEPEGGLISALSSPTVFCACAAPTAPMRSSWPSVASGAGSARVAVPGAETAAHLVDHVIPRLPVRQWVISFPIPLRLLFAAHPQLLAPVLQIVHRVIGTFLIKQAGLKR